MIDKFGLYRFIFPFRSRLQNRLREERLNVGVDDFARGFKGCLQADVPCLLWELLREAAFVPDFRPSADDVLSNVYGMGPEEVLDELIEPLLDTLGLTMTGVDFAGFDLVVTPRDVVNFVGKVAETQNNAGERRLSADMGNSAR